MADNLRGYTPFELFNKVLNTDNNSLQVDIVDATGVTVTVDSEFPAAATLADNTANPTTTSVASFLMGYDSSNTNWNRVEVDDDGNLQVDVVSTPGDDSIVTLGTTTYSETSSKGTGMGAVRNDVLAALANTDNEWAPLQVNASGALYIDVAGGGVLESAVDGIETLLGTIDSDTNDIKTATELIGTAVGTDGSTGPAKVMSVGGTDGSGNVQEIAVDSSGNVQVDLVSAAVTNAGTFAVQADLGSNNDIKIESGQVKSGAIASGAIASGAIASGAIVDVPPSDGHGTVAQFTTNIAGTATQLDAHACKHADVMGKVGNAGIVYVGGSGVAATTGIALYPGDVYSVDVTNTNLLYGIAVNANDDLQVVYYN